MRDAAVAGVAAHQGAKGRGDRNSIGVDDLVAEIVGRDGLLFEFCKVAVELSLGGGKDRGYGTVLRRLSDAGGGQRNTAKRKAGNGAKQRRSLQNCLVNQDCER